ncbi:hypothetical protein cypCar_00031869 [Cyprinus carpio]|nr:hypothetical protein cypCar_00031869 [Cyprinus carpio]
MECPAMVPTFPVPLLFLQVLALQSVWSSAPQEPGIFLVAGIWDQDFYHENQDLRSFLGTKYTKVPMMHRSGVYHHYEDMENMVQVLELGLWEGKASMVLLLPFHVESLARLHCLLTQDRVEKWLGKLSSTSMALYLQRTKISSTISLQIWIWTTESDSDCGRHVWAVEFSGLDRVWYDWLVGKNIWILWFLAVGGYVKYAFVVLFSWVVEVKCFGA